MPPTTLMGAQILIKVLITLCIVIAWADADLTAGRDAAQVTKAIYALAAIVLWVA